MDVCRLDSMTIYTQNQDARRRVIKRGRTHARRVGDYRKSMNFDKQAAPQVRDQDISTCSRYGFLGAGHLSETQHRILSGRAYVWLAY